MLIRISERRWLQASGNKRKEERHGSFKQNVRIWDGLVWSRTGSSDRIL
jgi:hypothetical protein